MHRPSTGVLAVKLSTGSASLCLAEPPRSMYVANGGRRKKTREGWGGGKSQKAVQKATKSRPASRYAIAREAQHDVRGQRGSRPAPTLPEQIRDLDRRTAALRAVDDVLVTCLQTERRGSRML